MTAPTESHCLSARVAWLFAGAMLGMVTSGRGTGRSRRPTAAGMTGGAARPASIREVSMSRTPSGQTRWPVCLQTLSAEAADGDREECADQQH